MAPNSSGTFIIILITITIILIISNLLQVNLPGRALLLRPTEDVQGAIVEVANKNRVF